MTRESVERLTRLFTLSLQCPNERRTGCSRGCKQCWIEALRSIAKAENAELKCRLERFVELIKSEICPDFIGLVEHKDLDCRHVCRQCWRDAIEKGCQ